MSTPAVHPLAGDHVPHFIATADGGDYLFTAMVWLTVILVLLIGVGYFTLHALPEKLAHKVNHPQLQLVGILAILALFTHNNLFWIAAILLAGLNLPDLLTPIRSIASSLDTLADNSAPRAGALVEPGPAPPEPAPSARVETEAASRATPPPDPAANAQKDAPPVKSEG